MISWSAFSEWDFSNLTSLRQLFAEKILGYRIGNYLREQNNSRINWTFTEYREIHFTAIHQRSSGFMIIFGFAEENNPDKILFKVRLKKHNNVTAIFRSKSQVSTSDQLNSCGASWLKGSTPLGAVQFFLLIDRDFSCIWKSSIFSSIFFIQVYFYCLRCEKRVDSRFRNETLSILEDCRKDSSKIFDLDFHYVDRTHLKVPEYEELVSQPVMNNLGKDKISLSLISGHACPWSSEIVIFQSFEHLLGKWRDAVFTHENQQQIHLHGQ